MRIDTTLYLSSRNTDILSKAIKYIIILAASRNESSPHCVVQNYFITACKQQYRVSAILLRHRAGG